MIYNGFYARPKIPRIHFTRINSRVCLVAYCIDLVFNFYLHQLKSFTFNEFCCQKIEVSSSFEMLIVIFFFKSKFSLTKFNIYYTTVIRLILYYCLLRFNFHIREQDKMA